MSQAMRMIETYPRSVGSLDREALTVCIEECLVCAQACTACADACLAEESIDRLRTCVRMNLDCAAICETTAAVLSRRTGDNTAVAKALLEACRRACQVCAAECDEHADRHAHCSACANACRRCDDACAMLLPRLD